MKTRVTERDRPVSQVELFCPVCQKRAPSDNGLCSNCGETLRALGYCEVCRDWVLRQAGEDCPKHDIPLVEGPSVPDFAPSTTRMVTIATYGLTSEAQAPRIRLEAEGIPVFLDGERMGMNAIYQVATGGVKLLVPEEYAADARIILAQNWSPSKDTEGHDEDIWEELEPPHPSERRRAFMKRAIVFYLVWPFLAVSIAYLIGFLMRLMD